MIQVPDLHMRQRLYDYQVYDNQAKYSIQTYEVLISIEISSKVQVKKGVTSK